jgi:hypothetical protein
MTMEQQVLNKFGILHYKQNISVMNLNILFYIIKFIVKYKIRIFIIIFFILAIQHTKNLSCVIHFKLCLTNRINRYFST